MMMMILLLLLLLLLSLDALIESIMVDENEILLDKKN